jgi:glutathione peroxidase-family protein
MLGCRGFTTRDRRPLMAKFHDLEMTSITGEPVNFADFSGQLCLIVNVASE